MTKHKIKFIEHITKYTTLKSVTKLLSVVVVFVTTYMLILPAITLTLGTAAGQGGIDAPVVAAKEVVKETVSAETRVEAADKAAGKFSDEAVDEAGTETETDTDTDSVTDLDKDTDRGTDRDKGAARDKAAAKEAKKTDPGDLVFEGDDYSVTVIDKNSILPESVHVEAEEIQKEDEEQAEAFDEYLAKTEAALGWDEGTASYARIFDIKIVDSEGNKFDIPEPVDVMIKLEDRNRNEGAEEPHADGDPAPEDLQVVHFADDAEEPDVIAEVETNGEEITFEAESFSAYAIVEGPSEGQTGWKKVSSMAGLEEWASKGLYIGNPKGYYFTAESAVIKGTRTGIVKTQPAHPSYPAEGAVPYYFEPAGGDGQYYIYCMDGSSKKYVRNTGNNSLSFAASEAERTAFTVELNNGTFSIRNGKWYWNMQAGESGKCFAAYDKDPATGANNQLNFWYYEETDEDPYGLDGRTYGLMSWTGGTAGKALMAEEQDSGSLAAKQLTVMSHKDDNETKLFVPKDGDAAMWTFEWIESDRYNITTIVDGSKKYLSIGQDGLSLVSTPDDSCEIAVNPGAGAHAGEISLSSGNRTLTYSGDINSGFNTSGAAGSEWLNLVKESELTSDYMMVYSAAKVSVSDPEVTDGSRIIIYTRVWNDTKKKYELFAIDHDGSLVPCYESGDVIQWTGKRLNTLLWDFRDYSNDYYDLYNEYSGKYLSPQVSGDQVLSDKPVGVNLDGRRKGAYYTKITAWDDDSYAYAGLTTDNDSIAPCDGREGKDFFFAIVQDSSPDDQPTPVPTVDHVKNGITMKMADFKDMATMSNFLGNDEGGLGNVTKKGLLSTNLGDDGYPTVTKSGASLGDLYKNPNNPGPLKDVNHLFIKSTYDATGYYEYDSAQNFASLQGNDFVVYKEIGTTDNGDRPTLKHGQFFPYNDIAAGQFAEKNDRNLYDTMANELPESDPRKYEKLYRVDNTDYQFGMELDASFVQTPDGLDQWNHDIIYEFTGDDDFWLYVDGELVIDLGGKHSAVPGYVNYRTGEVSVNGEQTTLRAIFENNYRSRNPQASDADVNNYLSKYFERDSTIFKPYSTHTMRIFYMERGGGASNLHMRFNLASVKPGTVELNKELTGTDESETAFAEFPYQIKYKMTEDGAEETLVQDSNDPAVCYKDTVTPVRFEPRLTIDGKTYENVFLLKPGETAEISFPENTFSYNITECGVDTSVYDGVRINEQTVQADPGSQNGRRNDYSTGYSEVKSRAQVFYRNNVDPDAQRTLTISKKLFREDGVTRINDDATEFNFRLYLGTELDTKLPAADKHTYHVKAAKTEGGPYYYCKWDKASKSFVPTEWTDYTALTAAQKKEVSFETSMNGAISKIPADYIVEIREVLAGTRYKVEEKSSEIPDGYSLQKYVRYDDVNDTEHPHISETEPAAGVVTVARNDDGEAVGNDPHVDVCNLKGWGLRVNKIWPDDGFVEDRDPVYFGVFREAPQGTLTLIDDTLRLMPQDENTLYWYFKRLPVNNSRLEEYRLMEVSLTGAEVNDEGYVTGYSEMQVLAQNDSLTLEGRQKGESGRSNITYVVHYEEGQPEEGSNVRADTVTNYRAGIRLIKQNWNGEPLEGAAFELKDIAGNIIGEYTSGEDGLIAEVFLGEDTDYKLTEVSTPEGYYSPGDTATIRVSGTDVTVTAGDEAYENYYAVDTSGGGTAVIVKNRPSGFRAVKVDGSSEPLAGAVFELHKEVKVGDDTQYDVNPMPGYENLVSGADGVIDKIDESLPPGRYELREKSVSAGYQKLPSYVYFTKSRLGKITLGKAPDNVTLTDGESGGKIEYVLTLPNLKYRQVSVWKTGLDHDTISTGASFTLYKAEDYDDGKEQPAHDAVAVTTGTTGTNGILYLGSLAPGNYRLVETKAPDGYNKAGQAIRITVGATGVSAMQGTGISEVSTKGDEHWVSGQGDDTYQIRVWNNPGVALPYTGGIGTALFYVLGSILTAGSAVLMIARRRIRTAGRKY